MICSKIYMIVEMCVMCRPDPCPWDMKFINSEMAKDKDFN